MTRQIEGYNNPLYTINFVKIDKVKDITDEVIRSLKECPVNDKDEYNIKYYIDHKIEISNKCILEMEVETKVHKSDIHYYNKVDKPCRKYIIRFNLFDNEHELTGFGFGFMDKENLTKKTYEKGIELRFDNWILPGDGSLFTITHKK